MALVGNVLWFILGGGVMALIWLVIGLALYITIIGIPIGKACLEFAKLSAFPFDKEVIRTTTLKGKHNVSVFSKTIATILNIIWIPLGIMLTICHFILGIIYAVTILGIPIAIVYFRMGRFLLAPIGCRVVSKKQAYASAVINEMENRFTR